MSLTPYEQCLAFYRRWTSDYHMTIADIDNTDLELLLDMEVLDSKICAEAYQQSKKGNKKVAKEVFIDQIL